MMQMYRCCWCDRTTSFHASFQGAPVCPSCAQILMAGLIPKRVCRCPEQRAVDAIFERTLEKGSAQGPIIHNPNEPIA